MRIKRHYPRRGAMKKPGPRTGTGPTFSMRRSGPPLLSASRQPGGRSALVFGGVPERVLGASQGTLRLALGLVGRAFRLKFGVPGDLAGRLLHGALGLIGRACNPVLIHNHLLLMRLSCPRNAVV